MALTFARLISDFSDYSKIEKLLIKQIKWELGSDQPFCFV